MPRVAPAVCFHERAIDCTLRHIRAVRWVVDVVIRNGKLGPWRDVVCEFGFWLISCNYQPSGSAGLAAGVRRLRRVRMHTSGLFVGFRNGAWYFVNPYGRTSVYPEDGLVNVTMSWDDSGRYRMEFFPLQYGTVHRYCGLALPASDHCWLQCAYLPPLELELLIVRLAARGVRFRDIRKRVGRPRWELAVILNWHGYPGLSHAMHGDGEGWEFLEGHQTTDPRTSANKSLGTETPN